MKIFSKTRVLYIIAGALMMAASSAAAHAQAFTPAKVAVINSSVFSDPKAGVTRLTKAFAALNIEFQPRKDELTKIRGQIDTLTKEVTDTAKIASQTTLQAKMDQIDQLKRDLQRKTEDAQAAYDRRSQAVAEPIQNDIATALGAYSKKRGIDIVLDMNQNANMLVFNEAVDITTAFIAEYNAKPATP